MKNLNYPNNELIDVVNEADVVIGSRSKDDIHQLGLLHREVHVWLFDKDKNVYFEKTSAKKSSAGLLDAPVGGHVEQGEGYIAAAVRETKEESSLSIDASNLILLNKFKGISRNGKRINNFFRSIYIYKYPVNEDEIKAFPEENDGFEKFSMDVLVNLDEEEKVKFHKFVPTHEIPLVLKYLNTERS